MVADAGIAIFAHDVLLQHLRFRLGAIAPIAPEDNDALAVLGFEGGGYNVVIDHVSLSWSEDEAFSTYAGAHDVTLSWSMSPNRCACRATRRATTPPASSSPAARGARRSTTH